MRKLSNAINIITILIIIAYVFFTHKIYELLVKITGNTTTELYNFSKIPYYLLWGSLIISLLIKIIPHIINKKNNIVVIFTSDVIIIILVFASLFLTTPFEFLYNYSSDSIYPESIRYDKLFVQNKFHKHSKIHHIFKEVWIHAFFFETQDLPNNDYLHSFLKKVNFQ